MRLSVTATPVLLVFLAFLSTGCALRPAPAPISTRDLTPREASSCLVVLLPGRWDGPRDFEEHRFAEILAEAGVDARVVAVNAHLGYYRKRTLVERIRADVVDPARAAGVERVWLAGPSLGGFGGLLAAQEMPETVEGVVAIAPFLGDDAVLDSIREAGGPREWRAPPPSGERDFSDLWRWLQETTASDSGPVLILGYGRGDDFAEADGLLAELLPPSRVYVRDGGHDWGTWTALWREIVADGRICE